MNTSISKHYWKGYYNTQQMVQQLGDHVITVQTADKLIPLQRVDPSTAERQLRNRLTMDGNWSQENYICRDSKR